jgi:hypothetical protein
MDGLARAVGNGISSLISTAFEVIGGTLRAMVNSANSALPGYALPIMVFVVLVMLAWFLAKR